jgi:hypothetical protein
MLAGHLALPIAAQFTDAALYLPRSSRVPISKFERMEFLGRRIDGRNGITVSLD